MNPNHIAKTNVGPYTVSTVRLGDDCFETMIFGEGPLDQRQERFKTRGEAARGHEAYCKLARYEVEGKAIKPMKNETTVFCVTCTLEKDSEHQQSPTSTCIDNHHWVARSSNGAGLPIYWPGDKPKTSSWWTGAMRLAYGKVAHLMSTQDAVLKAATECSVKVAQITRNPDHRNAPKGSYGVIRDSWNKPTSVLPDTPVAEAIPFLFRKRVT